MTSQAAGTHRCASGPAPTGRPELDDLVHQLHEVDVQQRSGLGPAVHPGHLQPLLHSDGARLGAAAEGVPGRIKTVTRFPDDHDSELVQITTAQNFEDSECAPTTDDGPRIYPPGSTEAAYVPFEIQARQGEGVQQLQVSPVSTFG